MSPAVTPSSPRINPFLRIFYLPWYILIFDSIIAQRSELVNKLYNKNDDKKVFAIFL